VQSEELASEAGAEEPLRLRRRQRHNELSRISYYRYRIKYLAHRKRRYHENQQVRQRKLEYQKRYLRNNLEKILAYQKNRWARKRLSEVEV
jgi:hypothetical protein